MMSVVVGRDFANQGGWDNFNWLYDTMMVSPYTEAFMPFSNNDMVEFQFNSIGLNLQLVNDEPLDGSHNGSDRQPAWILEYTKAFGPVTPLIQYGSYDLNKSYYLAAGLAYNDSGLDVYFDYVMDKRALPNDLDKQNTHTNIVLDLAYTAGDFKPFVKFAKYDVKQEGTDLKANTIVNDPDTAGNESIESVDTLSGLGKNYSDNATSYAVGTKFLGISPSFIPFLAINSISGKFANSASKETTRTDMTIRAGVYGQF
jgi:hypothetical protein